MRFSIAERRVGSRDIWLVGVEGRGETEKSDKTKFCCSTEDT